MDADERFWSKVEAAGCCWWWTGAASSGYGSFWLDGRTVIAHRYAWESLVGPLGDLEPDHLCLNTMCVNPDHLEPVTHAENLRRKWAKLTKGSCPSGHLWSEGDWWITASGRRRCRACHRARAKRAYEPSTRSLKHAECKRGHALEGDNVIVDKRSGSRKCRTCERNRQHYYKTGETRY